MTARTRPTSKCTYCGREMASGSMGRHLGACPQRQEVITESDKRRGRTQSLYHLRVRDAWQSGYNFDLEMSGSRTLEDLDGYLRAIWLECCGHLSQFSIGGWGGDEISKQSRVDKVLQPDAVVTHIYDFGTSSETLIKLVATREGKPTTSNPIALMARNTPPQFECTVCGQPASRLCIECIEDEADGALCDQHAKEHPHDDFGEPMPLVNSPRVGMCGYEGPAEPPY